MTQAGVGTNRFSYSANDPVNLSDPGGNLFGEGDLFGRGGFFDNIFGGDNRRNDSNGDGQSDWAEFQLAAYQNGGSLSFDSFQLMTGIDLYAGLAAPLYESLSTMGGGAMNPLGATAARDAFTNAHSRWTAGQRFYLADGRYFTPDAMRLIRPGVYEFVELKGGYHSIRGRTTTQSAKYAEARNGVYDSKGNRLGVAARTTYLSHDSKRSGAKITDGFRNQLISDGHRVRSWDGSSTIRSMNRAASRPSASSGFARPGGSSGIGRGLGGLLSGGGGTSFQ